MVSAFLHIQQHLSDLVYICHCPGEPGDCDRWCFVDGDPLGLEFLLGGSEVEPIRLVGYLETVLFGLSLADGLAVCPQVGQVDVVSGED